MEEYYLEEGIFIHSENLESKFLIECLQSLIAILPDMKIIQVIRDSVINGYKLYFKDLNVKAVVDRQYITVAERQIFIYPLTTCLVIHDAFINDDGSLIPDIRNIIEDKFGKILYYKQLPRTSNAMESSTNYFLIRIDIPEMKNLTVFQKNGYPKMNFNVPSVSKTFTMEFWCRNCKNPGHIYQECFKNGNSRKKSTLSEQLNPSVNDMHYKPYMNVKQGFSFSEFPDSVSSFLESTESFAPKVGRELAMKVGLSDENYISNPEDATDESNSCTSPIKYTMRCRREVVNQALHEENSSGVKINEMLNANEMHSNITDGNPLSGNKTFKIKREVNNMSFNSSEESSSAIKTEGKRPHPSSSPCISDDDVMILDDNALPQNSYSKNVASEIDRVKSEDPISASYKGHSSLNSTNSFHESTPKARNQRFSTPKQQIEMTRVLSERLQNCIDKSCSTGVLDRKTLDAFLTHVKKKSNPIRVADNYTTDAQCLKKQLQEIVSLYYNAPQTGTKEDTAFIKWLSGLIERFDGSIPRKRRPAEKLSTEIPSKKEAS